MQSIVFTSPEELGTYIRTMRKALGLTQSDVALAANVGIRFIVDLEAGKATIQIGKALQVIDVLGGTLSLTWAE